MAQGGARCVCPPAVRNAQRRAGYAAGRAGLTDGLPDAPDIQPAGTRPPGVGEKYEPTSRTDMAQQIKDLRRELVGDTARPDAALEYAAEITRQRLESAARGHTSDHHWSFGNRSAVTHEAALRGPKITGWLGGSRQWEAAGREVLPGAKPYSIWVPVAGGPGKPKDTEAPAKPGKPAKPEEEKDVRGVRFVTAPVYDWTQTRRIDGAADPSWSPTIPGGSEALYRRMVDTAPLPVIEDAAGGTGQAHGWTDGRKIVLDARRPVGDRIATLAHEHGHVALNHPARVAAGEITRAEAEQEAELTSYLIVRGLGLGADTDAAKTAATAGCLRGWTSASGGAVTGHKARWKMLEARITIAGDAAAAILTGLLGIAPARTEAAA